MPNHIPLIAGAVLLGLSGAAAAAAFDLSMADDQPYASFTKAVTFSGASAIAYDYVYPAGSPPATVAIELTETANGTIQDIQWTSVDIISGGQTTTVSLHNGEACGPQIQPTRSMPGGGTLVIRDAAAMKLTVTQMPLAPTLRIVLSGRVVGTGTDAGIKGGYVLSVKRILPP